MSSNVGLNEQLLCSEMYITIWSIEIKKRKKKVHKFMRKCYRDIF
jgi:hypothetical protein